MTPQISDGDDFALCDGRMARVILMQDDNILYAIYGEFSGPFTCTYAEFEALRSYQRPKLRLVAVDGVRL